MRSEITITHRQSVTAAKSNLCGSFYNYYYSGFPDMACIFMYIAAEAICYLAGLGYDPTNTKEKEWGSSITTVQLDKIEVGI